MSTSAQRLVNLGCGERFHPNWINFDLISNSPQVHRHDLSRGVPLPDASCDVVYHSHVLEHIRKKDVAFFMKECRRVLRIGGVIRIAVPDLERICRLYLEKLEGALRGDRGSACDYDWLMLELYDQTVREHWKSPMWDYVNTRPVANPEFLEARIGKLPPLPSRPIYSNSIRRFAVSVLDRLSRFKSVRAWRIGRFRLSGVVHQWMYDRFSLARLLTETGFTKPTQHSATSSLIPGWTSFNLDNDEQGKPHKPDSLYMEAVKP